MLLQYIHIIFLPHDAINFMKCTSPPTAKHPHNMMLPPPYFMVGMVFVSLQASPVSSKHNEGPYGRIVLFLFRQTRGHLPMKYDLCPHVQLQTVVWLFFWRFWSSGFFLAERPFSLCQYRTCFTVYIDTFVPVSSNIFTRSFAVVLGLICTWFLLPEQYDGSVVPWCLYLRTIVCTDERGTFMRLERWTRLVQVYNFFSEVLADFFWFSHDVKQIGVEFEGRPWNTSTCTPPIDSNDVT